MNTRKRYHWAVLLAGAMMAGSCAADYELATDVPEHSLHLRAEVRNTPLTTRSLNENETGDVINSQWKKGEKIALIYTPTSGTATKVEAEVTEVKLDGSAVIEGELETVPAAGADVKVIYPASAADGATGNVRADVLAEQDGTLETISEKFDVAVATTTLVGPAADGSVSFAAPLELKHRNAICRLVMLDVNRSPLTATKLVVSDITGGADNIITTVTLPAEGDTVCYVALPEIDARNHNFIATVGDYTYAISGKGILKAGCYYQDEMLMKFCIEIKEKTFTVNGVSFDMVQVDGGTFEIGASTVSNDPRYDHSAYHDAYQVTPIINPMKVRTVTLSTYNIGKYEVTNQLWNAVMGDTKPTAYTFPNAKVKNALSMIVKNEEDDYPVAPVTRDEANAFITKLNELLADQLEEGWKFHLPTQAQWEVAARGGQYNTRFYFAGSNVANYVAWYVENSPTGSIYKSGKYIYPAVTQPVGQKLPNELGLYDMSGNAWEWSCDTYNFTEASTLMRGNYLRETDEEKKAEYYAEIEAITSLANFQDGKTDPFKLDGDTGFYCGGDVKSTRLDSYGDDSSDFHLWHFMRTRYMSTLSYTVTDYIGFRLVLSKMNFGE